MSLTQTLRKMKSSHPTPSTQALDPIEPPLWSCQADGDGDRRTTDRGGRRRSSTRVRHGRPRVAGVTCSGLPSPSGPSDRSPICPQHQEPADRSNRTNRSATIDDNNRSEPLAGEDEQGTATGAHCVPAVSVSDDDESSSLAYSILVVLSCESPCHLEQLAAGNTRAFVGWLAGLIR